MIASLHAGSISLLRVGGQSRAQKRSNANGPVYGTALQSLQPPPGNRSRQWLVKLLRQPVVFGTVRAAFRRLFPGAGRATAPGQIAAIKAGVMGNKCAAAR
ncbi:hypothetical protein WN982_14515 [Paraburkholderia sp. IMGN_8]|uniref:hypothetical protein n=1 Tax=Paraburkholderia sp. IMGN_8 TaxID=3136564 RepID=UPI0031019074